MRKKVILKDKALNWKYYATKQHDQTNLLKKVSFLKKKTFLNINLKLHDQVHQF